jgi:hypothetical protein
MVRRKSLMLSIGAVEPTSSWRPISRSDWRAGSLIEMENRPASPLYSRSMMTVALLFGYSYRCGQAA